MYDRLHRRNTNRAADHRRGLFYLHQKQSEVRECMKYFKPGEIRCWSCKQWMSNNEFENADGYCAHCDAPIDVLDEPYIELVDIDSDD